MANSIRCPHCGQTYDLTPEQVPQYAGRTIACTSCNRAFTVPGAGTAPAPPLAPSAAGAYPAQSVPYASAHAYAPAAPQQGNGLAVTSLVCGIIGLIIPLIPGIIAIITGILGLRKTRDPNVGGKGLAIAGISVGAASILLGGCVVSILLPSLNRAREQANRIKCASNMRQIGLAIQMYASNNRGAFPPNLDVLLAGGGGLTPSAFVCPSSAESIAPGTTTLTPGSNLSYVYVPGLTFRAPSNAIVLYENPSNHRGDGINVLHADGSVTFLAGPQAQQMINNIQSGQNPPPP